MTVEKRDVCSYKLCKLFLKTTLVQTERILKEKKSARGARTIALYVSREEFLDKSYRFVIANATQCSCNLTDVYVYRVKARVCQFVSEFSNTSLQTSVSRVKAP